MKNKRTHRFKWPLTAMLVLFLVPVSCFAASSLSFGDVIEKAVKNTHDVRIAGVDIEIGKASREEALSLYYPSLSGRWNSEYVKDLSDSDTGITSVGNTVFGENTMYRNSFSLNASYGLYDFGTRAMKVLAAGKDIEAKKTLFFRSVRDVKLRATGIYTELLLVSKEIDSKKELLDLYKELALTKERLYAAGAIPKTEMADEAIKVIKTIDAVEGLKLRLRKALEDLSVYTGERYDVDNIHPEDLPEADFSNAKLNAEQILENKIYDLEIGKKEAELEILKNDRYPKFDFYSSYVWYGKDGSDYGKSIDAMESYNYLVGISGTIPLFDGFGTSARIQRTKLEIERLRLEKERAVADVTNRCAKLEEASRYLAGELKARREIVAGAEENLSMVSRLTARKAAEYADYLNRKIDLANEKWEITRTKITQRSALLQLQIFSEAMN